MTSEALAPEAAPARLCELSSDVRAAVLLDDAGRSVASCERPGAPASADGLTGEEEGERRERLGRLAADVLTAADRAAHGRPAEVEAQVAGGAVFVARGRLFTLVAVARRSALSALALYDMRAILGALEDGLPIRIAGEDP